MKKFLILASALLLAACASNPTQPSTRVMGSSSTNYTTFYRQYRRFLAVSPTDDCM